MSSAVTLAAVRRIRVISDRRQAMYHRAPRVWHGELAARVRDDYGYVRRVTMVRLARRARWDWRALGVRASRARARARDAGDQRRAITRHTRPLVSSVMYSDPSGPSARPPGRAAASFGFASGVLPAKPSANTSYGADGLPFANGTNVTL